MKTLASGRYQIDYRDSKGVRHRESFDRLKDARAAEAGRREQIRKGEFVAPKDIPTFEQIALGWFEEKKVAKARGSDAPIKKATLDKWSNHLHKHLLPIYGPRRMDTIQTTEIEKSREVWQRAGLCPKSVNELLVTFSAVFNEAIRQGTIRVNPAALAHRLATGSNVADEAGNGSAEVSDDQVYDGKEIQRLIDGAEPGLYRMLFTTLALTGLRHGEAAALKWSDVDVDARIVKVNQNWANVYDQNGNPTFTTPKTRSSRRTIPNISSSLALELRKWKLRCPASEWNLVFPKADGSPLDRKSTWRAFDAAVRNANRMERVEKLRRLTVHSLRHSFASLLLAHGTPITEVSAYLGHKNPQITLSVYSHFIPSSTNGEALAWLADGIVEHQSTVSERRGHFMDTSTLIVASESEKTVVNA